jgi:DnaJ-class molecular chaperone
MPSHSPDGREFICFEVVTCDYCNGAGYESVQFIGRESCIRCHGTGKIRLEVSLGEVVQSVGVLTALGMFGK